MEDIVDPDDAVPADPMVLEDPDGIVEPADPGIEDPLEPDVAELEVVLEPEPVAAPELEPGCIAEDPDVVEPEPVAAGRSVPPEGAVVDWAKAGAVASAVATRQAAICVFSIWIS